MLRQGTTDAPAELRDAATVVLLRQRPGEAMEVFLVQRHGHMAFMGGTYVFPGGKLDPEDLAPELHMWTQGRTPEGAADALGEPDDPVRAVGLFVAAIRETFEEAGYLLAAHARGADLGTARARMMRGRRFAAVMADLSAMLCLDRLVPCARWITPVTEPRRFDARFFLAEAPANQTGGEDNRETIRSLWLRPAEALARSEAGDLPLPPPTRRTLETLMDYASPEDALRAATARKPPRVEPVFQQVDGTWAVLLPGDPAHPVREPVFRGPVRYHFVDGKLLAAQPAASTGNELAAIDIDDIARDPGGGGSRKG